MNDSFEIKIDSIHNYKNRKNLVNNSFLDLTLSDIENKDKNPIILDKRSIYHQKEKEENDPDKMSSFESIKLEDFNNIFFTKKKYKAQLTKEDLNNIPLPIFSCIYCSNEKISFRHFIHEKLSKKYLILNSAYDIIELIKMQFYKNLGFYLMKEFENINRIINKNREKEEKIIKDSEYINRYYIYEESKKIL